MFTCGAVCTHLDLHNFQHTSRVHPNKRLCVLAVNTHMHLHIHTRIHTYTYTHTYIHTHTRLYKHTYTHTFLWYVSRVHASHYRDDARQPSVHRTLGAHRMLLQVLQCPPYCESSLGESKCPAQFSTSWKVCAGLELAQTHICFTLEHKHVHVHVRLHTHTHAHTRTHTLSLNLSLSLSLSLSHTHTHRHTHRQTHTHSHTLHTTHRHTLAHTLTHSHTQHTYRCVHSSCTALAWLHHLCSACG